MGFVYLYLLERLHAFSHVQYMIVEHKDTDVSPPGYNHVRTQSLSERISASNVQSSVAMIFGLGLDTRATRRAFGACYPSALSLPRTQSISSFLSSYAFSQPSSMFLTRSEYGETLFCVTSYRKLMHMFRPWCQHLLSRGTSVPRYARGGPLKCFDVQGECCSGVCD